MSLFQLGNFTLNSGQKSLYKIECDALTTDDWEALARMAAERLPPFKEVEGIPRCGLIFAEALQKYRSTSGDLLIADDVLTTGASMERLRAGREAIGIVAFARNRPLSWVTPLFQLYLW